MEASQQQLAHVGEDILDEIDRLRSDLEGLQRAVRDVQSVHSVINGNGTIAYGNGNISVVRNGVGDYTVTFDNPFDSTPVIQVTMGSLGGWAGVRLDDVNPPTPNDFRVKVFDTSTGALVDRQFVFTATHA